MASRLYVFLSELRRRKVIRVGLAYVAVAAGVVGVCDAGIPDELWGRLQVPVGVLLLVGLPVALLLAWAYEIKPEDRIPTQPPEGASLPPKNPGPHVPIPTPDQARSIVVLPFDNMSPDPGDAYLADGLTEEIITNLSYIRPLRVISRTSAMALKGTQKDSRTIARELDVRYVLEGSVRKAGDRLRITAQLIDGVTDTHLWAERYDGILEDVFAMQEQASRSIVSALKVALNPAEDRRLATSTVNELVAYECYLRARHQIWLMTDESLEEALRLLDRGLAVQPGNPMLLATKAFVHCQIVNAMGKSPLSYAELLREAEAWASEALASDPGSALAHFARASVCLFRGDPPRAIDHWLTALKLNPNHADSLNWLGFFLLAGGCCPERAQRLLAQAAKIDPLNPLNSEVGPSYIHWFNGDFPAVIELWKAWRTAESPLLRLYVGYFHAASGDRDEATRIFQQIIRDTPGHPAAAAGAFLGHALRGEVDLAFRSVTEALEQAAWWDDFTPILMAGGYALLGENERALHWVGRAIEMGTTNVAFLGEKEPFLRSLRGYPGFEDLLRKAQRLSEALATQVAHDWGFDHIWEET